MKKRSIVGLSGPFSHFGPAHCPRCSAGVQATWPWSGWVNLRKGWFVGIGLLAMGSPVWMADMYVLMPSAMLFICAIGPLNKLAGVRPTCLDCGCQVQALPLAGAKPAHG
jgi:hypothetical protein